MTLRQLLVRYNWLNIEAALLQEVPTCQKHLPNYESVYQLLLLMEVADTDLQIHLTASTEGHNNYRTVDVVGRKQVPSVAEAHLRLPFVLHFTPWTEWLAMPVSLRSLAQFSETEIVAHCLVEMTRKGFSDDAIQAKARHLHRVLDEMTKTGMMHL